MSLSLLHSQANIIRWLLINNLGLGVDPDVAPQGAWPIYATSEPDEPDSVITIYNTQGILDGRSMPTGEVFEHLGFQVRVRAITSNAGWTKANEIARQMAEVVYRNWVIVDSAMYNVYAITRKSGVLEVPEFPTSERKAFTINCIVALSRIN